MKTNTNIKELERKNNLVLQNLERLSRYYPNIEKCAEILAEKIEVIKFEREMENLKI